MDQITAALAAVRDTARTGDRIQYATALSRALALGCIDDQIEDAYGWGVRQRMRLATHLPGGIDFDWHGN